MHSAKDAWEGRLQALKQELQECKQAWKKDVAEKEASLAASSAQLVAKVQEEHAEAIKSLRDQYNASVGELKKVRRRPCQPRVGSGPHPHARPGVVRRTWSPWLRARRRTT